MQDKLHQTEIALDSADIIPAGFRFCGRAVILQDNEPNHVSKLPGAKEYQGLLAFMDFQFTVTRPDPKPTDHLFGNI